MQRQLGQPRFELGDSVNIEKCYFIGRRYVCMNLPNGQSEKSHLQKRRTKQKCLSDWSCCSAGRRKACQQASFLVPSRTSLVLAVTRSHPWWRTLRLSVMFEPRAFETECVLLPSHRQSHRHQWRMGCAPRESESMVTAHRMECGDLPLTVKVLD